MDLLYMCALNGGWLFEIFELYFYIIDLQSNIVICLIDINIEGFFPPCDLSFEHLFVNCTRILGACKILAALTRGL